MLDRIHAFTPFLPRACSRYRVVPYDAHSGKGGYIEASLDDDMLLSMGIPLFSSIQRLEDGTVCYGDLRHCRESLSTGFTPMSCKVWPRGAGYRDMPGIELKASPAKLLQGHNLFGSDSIAKGWAVMKHWLLSAYPRLYEMLDWDKSECYALDCTYSCKMPNEAQAKEVIRALSAVSYGQTKSRGNIYETSAYWYAKNSRVCQLKSYLKQYEYELQLKEYKKKGKSDPAAASMVELMGNPDLIEYSKYQLRIEATAKKRWLESHKIPYFMSELIEFQQQTEAEGGCLIRNIFEDIAEKLFKACEGQTMKTIEDDSVRKKLLDTYSKVNKKGKIDDRKALHLFHTYRNLKNFGWHETYQSMKKSTFNDHVRDICAIGISRASLEKLDNIHKNNVVPLLRFVTVDFSNQYPRWYVEPSLPPLLKAA